MPERDAAEDMILAERLLDARIEMTTVVRPPDEGWQARYCEAIDRIAAHYGVSAKGLAGAFFRYHNLTLLNPVST